MTNSSRRERAGEGSETGSEEGKGKVGLNKAAE